MITRYRVSFEDRLIEPDSQGRWVKYEDHQAAESSVEAQAQETVRAAGLTLQADLKTQTDRVAELAEINTRLESELHESGHNKEHYSHILKTARDRLKLLGHNQNCHSRYTATDPQGTSTGQECNCGLDEWMKESLNG